MAHGDIRIVAADHDLSAVGEDVALSVYAGVDDSLVSARANGFDLADRIRHLEKASASLKEMSKKIRA